MLKRNALTRSGALVALLVALGCTVEVPTTGKGKKGSPKPTVTASLSSDSVEASPEADVPPSVAPASKAPSLAPSVAPSAVASTVVVVPSTAASTAAVVSTAPTSTGLTAAIFAGKEAPGMGDGLGSTAFFNEPSGLAVGIDGAVYVADTSNHAVRKVTKEGTVSTIGGNSREGDVEGKTTVAKFKAPRGVAVAADGTVYVADSGNHKIRKIDKDGNVTTLAGGGARTEATPVFADGAGADARFTSPDGIAIGKDGAIYVADTGNNRIRRLVIDTAGAVTVSTLAGSGNASSTDGVGVAAAFSEPNGLATDKAGNLYVTEGTNLLRKVVVDEAGIGTVTTVAGGLTGSADGVGPAAQFSSMLDIAVGPDGVLYVADLNNFAVRKIVVGTDGKGTVTSLVFTATAPVNPIGLAVGSDSKLYFTEIGSARIKLVTLPVTTP